MRKPFEFTLEGRDWSQLYVWYWGPTLLLLVLSLAAPEPKADDPASPFSSLGISVAISFLSMLVQSFFTVPVLRTWLPRLSVDGKAFSFAGETNDYLVLNVKGFLLSLITLGVYLPFYTRDVLKYLARETAFDGVSPRFTGKAGTLLGALSLVLVAMVVLIGVVSLGAGRSLNSITATALAFGVVVLTLGPALYLVYWWMVQFSWSDRRIRWTTRFLPASSTVVIQLLLTVVSLGIWWPGALLILYRYFVAHTIVEDESGVRVRFAFEGRIGEGFRLLWGQTLLTLVTLGFYGAWSGPNISRWVAANTVAVTES